MHIVWVSETKLRNYLPILRITDTIASLVGVFIPKFRFFAIRTLERNDDKNGKLKTGSRWSGKGGGAFLVLDRRLEVNVIDNCPLGMLAISVMRKGWEKPVALLGAYNPPEGSRPEYGKRSGNKDKWCDDLLASIGKTFTSLRLSRVYAVVALMGDFNMRAGSLDALMKQYKFPPRVTNDKKTARLGKLSAFLRSIGAVIVHGCPGQPPGRITSRPVSRAEPVSDGAEVDFIIVPHDQLDMICATDNKIQWEHLPDTMTHLPLTFTLTVPTEVVDECPLIGERPRKPLPDVAYNDRIANTLIAKKVLPAAARAVFNAQHESLDGQYGALVRAFRDTGQKVLADAPLMRARRRPGYSNKHCPVALCRCLKSLRSSHHAVRSAKAKAESDGYRRSAVKLGKLQDDIKALHKQLQRKCRSIGRNSERQAQHVLLNELSLLRTKDPRSLFRGLNKVFPAAAHAFGDSSARPAMRPNYEHYRTLWKETRSTVPALESAEYDRFIPRAHDASLSSFLSRPFTRADVYYASFSPTKSMLGEYQPCFPGCAQCQGFLDGMARFEQGNPASRLPAAGAQLNGKAAPGSDGIRAGVLRYARDSLNIDQWVPDRLPFCDAFCIIANRCLAEQRVPKAGDWCHAEVTTLLKSGSPGNRPDPTNPKDSRGIAVGNLFPKIFGLMILKRISHWAIAQGIISRDQVGFMPYLGSESQVLAAIETIRLARRQRKWIACGFVDISQAYDSVFQQALFHILRTAGMPESIVNLLIDWFSSRTASIKIGKERSPRFPQDKGIPQGDVLSPLLWDIFFEPLLRQIEAEVPGVTLSIPEVAPLRLKKLAYADDLLILVTAASSEEAQQRMTSAMQTVASWASAWGVRLNVKANKTEAMLFDWNFKAGQEHLYCSCGPNAQLQPLDIGPTDDGDGRLLVHWVKEYRYLGFPLQLSLKTKSFVNKKAGYLEHSLYRYFLRDGGASELSYCLQTTMATTLCRSKINYLIGLFEVGVGVTDSLDRAMRAIARAIFDIPEGCPTQLADSEISGMPMATLILSDSIRIWKALQLVPAPFDQSPAAKVVAFQHVAGIKSNTFVGRVTKKVEEACSQLGRSDHEGISRAIMPAPRQYHEIEDAVNAFQVSSSYSSLWAGHRHNSLFEQGRTFSSRVEEAAYAACQPPSWPPLDALAALHCVGFRLSSEELTRYPYATPMSAVGPGCSGSLMRFTTTAPNGRGCIIARMGRKAFAYAPFCGTGCEAPGDIDQECGYLDEPKPPSVDRHVWLIKKYSRQVACPFCGHHEDGPFHLFCECPAPQLRRLRRLMVTSLLTMLERLSKSIDDAIWRSTTDQALARRVQTRTRKLRSRIRKFRQSAGEPQWLDVHFTAFRMMLVTPFPAKLPELAASMLPLSLRLGRVFDATVLPNNLMRAPANMVKKWGTEWTALFAGLRSSLLIENYRRHQQEHQ